MKVYVIALTVLLISFSLILFALNGYPVPDGDSYYFVIPAINWSMGKGLINQVSYLSTLDESGQGRFLYYVPLFPLLLGTLMSKHEPQSFFFVTSILNIVSIILCSCLFYRSASNSSTSVSWKGVILICFALTGMTSRILYQQYRPDCLGNIFFLIILVIIITNLSEKIKIFSSGILLGFLGATYPTPAIILALGLGIYYSIRFSFVKAIKPIMLIYFVSVVTFVFIIRFISPFSLLETINGLKKHSLLFKERFLLHTDFLYYYFTSPSVSFHGLILLLFIVFLGILYKKHLHKIKSRKLFFIFLFPLLIYLYFSVLWDIGTSYNILFFSPLFFSAIIFLFKNEIKLNLIMVMVLLCFLLTGTSYFRHLLLFPHYIKDGITLTKARAIFQSLKQSKVKYLLKGSALWVLSEDYNDFVPVETKQPHQDGMSILVLQQNYSGLLTPPQMIDSYKLIKDYFVHNNAKLLGLKLGNSFPHYGFAVYK